MNSADVEPYDVVIVGGGFSGVMVAVNAAVLAAQPLRIALVERKDEYGRGVAFAGTPRDALLNVPAGAMGAFPDQPDDFVNWLCSLAPKSAAAVDPAAYYPRELFGTYIGSLLADAERAGHDITCITAQIVDLERQPGCIAVCSANGVRVARGRQVVLALGAPPPADVVANMNALREHPRYVRDPWVFLKRSGFDAQGRIVLVGSGLTALDVIAAFARTGYSNELVVVSRSARFPQPHAPWAHAAIDPIPSGSGRLSLREVVRLVRAAVRKTDADAPDWRRVLDGLRPHIQELWLGFDVADRRRFLRHVRSIYDPHRHRAPSAVLAAKDRLVAAGRLRTVAGRISSIRAEADALTLTIRDRGSSRECSLTAAQVINCAGPGNFGAACAEPLMARLFERGEIVADPTGLGMLAQRSGRVIDAHGAAHPDLYTIGWSMRGVLLETTAVRELRAQARLLAGELSAARPAAVVRA